MFNFLPPDFMTQIGNGNPFEMAGIGGAGAATGTQPGLMPGHFGPPAPAGLGEAPGSMFGPPTPAGGGEPMAPKSSNPFESMFSPEGMKAGAKGLQKGLGEMGKQQGGAPSAPAPQRSGGDTSGALKALMEMGQPKSFLSGQGTGAQAMKGGSIWSK